MNVWKVKKRARTGSYKATIKGMKENASKAVVGTCFEGNSVLVIDYNYNAMILSL